MSMRIPMEISEHLPAKEAVLTPGKEMIGLNRGETQESGKISGTIYDTNNEKLFSFKMDAQNAPSTRWVLTDHATSAWDDFNNIMRVEGLNTDDGSLVTFTVSANEFANAELSKVPESPIDVLQASATVFDAVDIDFDDVEVHEYREDQKALGEIDLEYDSECTVTKGLDFGEVEFEGLLSNDADERFKALVMDEISFHNCELIGYAFQRHLSRTYFSDKIATPESVTVNIEFSVDDKGIVTRAVSDHRNDPRIESNLCSRFLRMSFEPHPEGKEVTVRLPITYHIVNNNEE